MRQLPDNIARLEASDGGDGSTYFSIVFTDGTEFAWNPDLPHDDFYGELEDGVSSTGLHVEFSNEHGERVMQGRQLSSAPYTDLPPIPAEGW